MNELYIGGAWAPSASGATSQTLNPYDASVLATVAEASAADVKRAVAAAREALPNADTNAVISSITPGLPRPEGSLGLC